MPPDDSDPGCRGATRRTPSATPRRRHQHALLLAASPPARRRRTAAGGRGTEMLRHGAYKGARGGTAAPRRRGTRAGRPPAHGGRFHATPPRATRHGALPPCRAPRARSAVPVWPSASRRAAAKGHRRQLPSPRGRRGKPNASRGTRKRPSRQARGPRGPRAATARAGPPSQRQGQGGAWGPPTPAERCPPTARQPPSPWGRRSTSWLCSPTHGHRRGTRHVHQAPEMLHPHEAVTSAARRRPTEVPPKSCTSTSGACRSP
mmetsp:Transcript_71868/g.222162  ORF Transcript_71868/g.222162 Transcript_71868/m.222162 type:complete len:261 (+) Transcript_71868:192-974(+)